MLLEDDSPLVPPADGAEPQTSDNAQAQPIEKPQTHQDVQLQSFAITFERPGSLGIEFEQLAAPYVVEQVHENGLAYGKGLEPGDRVEKAGGQDVSNLQWDDFVKHLTCRPVTVSFVRDPSKSKASGGTALLAGFAGRLGNLGGNITSSAQQGLGTLGGSLGGFGGGLDGFGRKAASAVTTSAHQGLGGLGGWFSAAQSGAVAEAVTHQSRPEASAAAGSSSEAAEPGRPHESTSENPAHEQDGSFQSAAVQKVQEDFFDGFFDEQEDKQMQENAGADIAAKAANREKHQDGRVSATECTPATHAVTVAEAATEEELDCPRMIIEEHTQPSQNESAASIEVEQREEEEAQANQEAVELAAGARTFDETDVRAEKNEVNGRLEEETTKIPEKQPTVANGRFSEEEFEGRAHETVGDSEEETAKIADREPASSSLLDSQAEGRNVEQISDGAEVIERTKRNSAAIEINEESVESITAKEGPIPETSNNSDTECTNLEGFTLDGDEVVSRAHGEAVGCVEVRSADDEDSNSKGDEQVPRTTEKEVPTPWRDEKDAKPIIVEDAATEKMDEAAAQADVNSSEVDQAQLRADEYAMNGGEIEAATTEARKSEDEDVNTSFMEQELMNDMSEHEILKLRGELERVKDEHRVQLAEVVSQMQAQQVTMQNSEARVHEILKLREELERIKDEHRVQLAEVMLQSQAQQVTLQDSETRAHEISKLREELERSKDEHRVQLAEVMSQSQAQQVTLQDSEARAQSALQEIQNLSAQLQTRESEITRLDSELCSSQTTCQSIEQKAQAEAAKSAQHIKELTTAMSDAQLERERMTCEAREAREAAARATASEGEARNVAAQHFQESSSAKGQLEQVRFALAERERQLSESSEVLARKDQEIKDLIRQLGAVGSYDGKPQPTADEQVESDIVSTFDVMFALAGKLGLEFQQLQAPYVIAEVLEGGVATGLGICPGDELIAVEKNDVTTAAWEQLVQRLSSRPVVATFRRAQQKEDIVRDGSGFISSVSSVGSTLLTAARSAVPGKAGSTSVAEPQDARLQVEVERLGTLLKAREEDIAELMNKLHQKDEALQVFQSGDASAADVAQLTQERTALSQQVEKLQTRADDADRQADQLLAERDRAMERCADEARLKEEQRLQVVALTEQCDSLMKQFATLSETCQGLSLDAQQKSTLEGQVQELMKVNASWQQAHQNLNVESENLRHQAEEVQQLRGEVTTLRRYEAACIKLEERLRELEAQLEASQEETVKVQHERLGDHETIQRLQTTIESLQESGDSETGQLEAELLHQSRECAALRREAEEYRHKVDELQKRQQEMREAAEEGLSMKAEILGLRRDIAKMDEEKRSLTEVVDRCVEKMEKDSRERPHLVDKRMVTQMLAAYLEQRDYPRKAQEIMAKMADLLGFTTAEREQVGLVQQRRSLLHQADEPASLSDSFMDFLLEEAED